MRPGPNEIFSRFLRGRRRLRHFARHPLLDALARRGSRAHVPAHLAQDLLLVARAEPAAALARLHAHAEGLSAREAAARLARHGRNVIEHDAPQPWWLHLWHCYRDPFNLLLTALAVVSYLTEDAKATVVIGVMVVLSTAIRFVQEHRSTRAAEALKAMVSNTATVLRQVRREIPISRLVPGDLVVLSAGDMIPADCRVLEANDLFIAQAALTGESLPLEKFADRRTEAEAPLEQRNLVFMGTNVVSGSATALVVNTGERTVFGALAARAGATDTAPNAFQAGINSVSWLLIRFAAVMVPVVLLVNGFTKGDWLEAFLFALSVAVGLTPEMLPMIVTSTLAKGAVQLSRRKVVVKRLDAIQNLGAMDILCTDKTGTLTQDKIALERHIDPFGRLSEEVLEFAYLNSHFQTGLKNLLDVAVLEHVDLAAELKLEQVFRKVDEIPFDFQRRRMSVVVSRGDGPHELICKGALEEVLAVCTRVRAGDEAGAREMPLDAAMLERVQRVTRELAESGLRVVAVAMKALPPGQTACSIADEAGLVLLGHVAFLDPPKESAAPALRALAAHGVGVKVLTGDNELVAAHVCARVGLRSGPVLLGSQVEGMSDEALGSAALAHDLFAKLAPHHKERIVAALRAQGHVVGFMGDGINDAPALRAADVGISVDSGVDIAKEAADVILLEKSLMVLDEGVVEGRATFCNMLKYIRMTASSNFGNVFAVLVASAFLPFLPMLPLHLLVQNLLYDMSQTGIPFDHVDAELVNQPLKWNPGDIGRFMLFFGPISSVFDLTAFAVMWWVFSANTLAEQGLFQSGWFVVGLLTQTLIVHMIRTPKLPFIESRASAPLTAMTGAIVLLGLWLPMGPWAGYFKLQALPPAFFAWLAGILLGYALLTTWMKRTYIRRFGWQ
ncbi:MAG: magnesium-translocating P-type ATPase [Ideonella sp.]|jgi:Mg2+-importing ATPase|nr:magnesium-translocating P-type ATPase [Ideonella sp.]